MEKLIKQGDHFYLQGKRVREGDEIYVRMVCKDERQPSSVLEDFPDIVSIGKVHLIPGDLRTYFQRGWLCSWERPKS